MSTIEKAAARLVKKQKPLPQVVQQPPAFEEEPAPVVASSADATLQAPEEKTVAVPHATAPPAPEPPPAVATPAPQASLTEVVVEHECQIDFEHLGAHGFLVPGHENAVTNREFRRIKRPLLLNTREAVAAKYPKPNNVIFITSAVSGEGKTFVSMNLALSLAGELDRSVLLVDGDAAKGDLSTWMGIHGEKGLVDLLQESNGYGESTVIGTNVDRLSVMPSGRFTDNLDELYASELFSATGVTAFEGVGLALQAGLPLAALIVLGVASQGLAAELARGTLRNLLVRPVARWQLALGKGLAAVLLGLAGYAVLAASAVAAAASFFDFTDVVEVLPNGATFPMVAAEELWPELRRALLAPILPLCAFAALGHLASSLPRTGAAALGLGLAMAVALDLSRGILRELDVVGWVPSAYLPSPLGDLSLIQYYVDVSQGVSNAIYDLSPGQLVPLAWTVVCLIVAVLVLGRRSIP